MTTAGLKYILTRSTNSELSTQFIRNFLHIVFPHISRVLECISIHSMRSSHKIPRKTHDEFVFGVLGELSPTFYSAISKSLQTLL